MCGRRELTTKSSKESFWSDGNILYLDYSTVFMSKLMELNKKSKFYRM